ncbi:DUF2231 domain-containing protein [Microvirga soli]|uniref:DUF2231 domain-containing protein n=1 Tax=Microvirga soli TaxID=1854496 RepID=UPI00191CDD89|nr:DUF2231 domain-containing protein [Microvirga soli]
MVAQSHPGGVRPLHPLHAILLAFPLPLFAGALASDFAYRATFHIQWANFSSWLIAGGLVGGGFALLWSLINLFRRRTASKGRLAVYFVVLLVMWGLGFVNALVHAKDAWATMPEGLYLSVITTLLALVAAWIGYSGFRTGDVR